MRRPTIFIAALVGAALFLSACTLSVEPPVRQPDVTLGTGSPDAPRRLSLPARGDLLVRIDLTQAERQADLLYVELDADLELELLDSRRNLIGSSVSTTFFGPGRSGITQAALEPQAIGASNVCRGSCVIVEPGASTGSSYYALINNPGGARNVGLFAFTDVYADEFEPSNNTPAGAPTIRSLGVENGAIETIGDLDYWRVEVDANLDFDAANAALDLVLWIQTPAGVPDEGPILPGSTTNVFVGDVILVESLTNRAAPSARSNYFLELR